jgi:hypothetical protein
MNNLDAAIRMLIVSVPVVICAMCGSIQLAILISVLALFVEGLTIESILKGERK